MPLTHALFILLPSISLTWGSVALADDPYTMADLEALLRSKGWLEILQHAKDIKPARRNARWCEITTTAAKGQLAELSRGKQRVQSLARTEAWLEAYPHLKKSRQFMSRRAKIGLEAFAECLVHIAPGSWPASRPSSRLIHEVEDTL